MRIHAAIDLNDPAQKELQSHFLAVAIERLYHPGFAKQDRHGACGAESIIRLTAFRKVGEWAKLAADLIVDGKSKVTDHIILEPAKDWARGDKSESRTHFDALLQSALMRFTAESQGYTYRNKDDKFERSDGTTTDGGMNDACAGKLISALVGEVSTSVDRAKLGANPAQQLGDLASKIGGVYVGLKWPDPDDPSGQGAHAVIVQGYDSKTDTVIFSNPHGETAGKANGDVLTEPARTIVDNAVGVQAMSAALFNTELLNAILPA
jgi:hypothetical protein